jgi:hypothetical protein
MKTFARFVLAVALAYLVVVLLADVQLQMKLQSAAEKPDYSRITVSFVVILGAAIAIGAMFALSVLPAIADKIGSFLFNPNQEIEKPPHSVAMAKMAQGDYHGAVEEYQKDPYDTLALSEIAHIYCDKLKECDAAAQVLEAALDREWPPEDSAFLGARLADVYWHHQNDAVRARAVLIQIAENLPDSKHAANAQHKLREIDLALARQH